MSDSPVSGTDPRVLCIAGGLEREARAWDGRGDSGARVAGAAG